MLVIIIVIVSKAKSERVGEITYFQLQEVELCRVTIALIQGGNRVFEYSAIMTSRCVTNSNLRR